MAPSPPENPRKWRCTWETLAHIPILRLYLFDSHTNPSNRCRNLNSSFRFEDFVLLIMWIEEDGDVLIRVPVPRVLIDPCYPVESSAKEDHIEVKLVLVLPVDHPLVSDFRGQAPDELIPLNLGSDVRELSSGNVHFFCKNCSAKLTRRPLSHFVEMPSVNWQEAADNWFGACCCSFGGVSEKLVSLYTNAYCCVEGICLVDAASVIVCKDDLEGCVFEHCLDGFSGSSFQDDLVANGGLNRSVEAGKCMNFAEDLCKHSEVGGGSHLVTGSRGYEDGLQQLSHPLLSSADNGSVNQAMNPVSVQISCVDQCRSSEGRGFIDGDFAKLGLNDHNIEKHMPDSLADDFSSADQCHCVVDRREYASNKHATVSCSMENSTPQRSQACLRNGSLGSGFLIRTSNLSNDVKWVKFLCEHCSSPLGSYPVLKDTNIPVDGGIRLFKCYVSTSIPVREPPDIFRKHTLQRVFVSFLNENAADELSFCTVVNDLRTNSQMLQVVLLNSKAWCATGYACENAYMEPLCEMDLQPVVKVLFSDSSKETGANSGEIKNWSIRNHVEELYMMKDQIQELTKNLNLALKRLPPSCSYLQGMSVAYMER